MKKKKTGKFYLHLGKYDFDPLKEKPEIAPDLKIEKKATHQIIQFKKTLTQDDKTKLQKEYGLLLKDYIPNQAFLEKIDTEKLTKLAKDPIFRTNINYEPAYKISPIIGQLKIRTKEREAIKGMLLRVILFSGNNPKALEKALQKIGATNIKILDDRKIGGIARIHFVLTSKDKLPKIAQLDGVRWIEEVSEIIEDNVRTAGTIQSGTPGNEPIWDKGIQGKGQTIGIIDSAPLDINHCFFRDPTNNNPGANHRKIIDIRNATGTAAGGHATFVAGCAAGDDLNNPGTANRRGGAWAARLISGNGRDMWFGLATMLSELNAASKYGATIHSNSWHDDTGIPALYNQTSADVDSFTWNNEDHLVLGSAGNSGEEQGPPGTSKNAICVCASLGDPNEMNFGDGNPGPTDDGRRKPDLTAPGGGIQSATVNTACSTGPRSPCATSYATPHVAAAAALIRQYFMEGWYPTGTKSEHHTFTPSGALLKAMLLNSTINMTGIPGFPSNLEGWGLIRLNNVLFFRGNVLDLRVWEIRNSNGINTGSTRKHYVNIATNTQPLKVTLVWTEPPALSGSTNPVINNLDLEVTSPDGSQTFLGNRFVGGVSSTGGTADTLNNVETVLINNPIPGEWTIKVKATQVNVGNPGQGYALVVTGDINHMITFKIQRYQVYKFTGRNEPVRIYMNDENNRYRGYIEFIKDYSGYRKYIVHPNGIINAFMPLVKLHPTLDILRNEKPVYFSVNEVYNWAALKTGYEPTGEEEIIFH